MATVDPTILHGPLEAGGDQSVILVTWVLTSANNDGRFVSLPEYADKTWTFGNGASDAFSSQTVSIYGKNAAGDTEQILNKPVALGAASFTSAGMCATVEDPLLIAPKVTSGGSATLTCRLLARRANPLRQ